MSMPDLFKQNVIFVLCDAGFTQNRPFAQLLAWLETGHPVTVGQSPAHESHPEQSETETRKTAFCSS